MSCSHYVYLTMTMCAGPLHANKPCSFYLEGCCYRSDCKFSHDICTITCHFWEEGQCFKGDLCPFLHGYFRFATWLYLLCWLQARPKHSFLAGHHIGSCFFLFLFSVHFRFPPSFFFFWWGWGLSLYLSLHHTHKLCTPFPVPTDPPRTGYF